VPAKPVGRPIANGCGRRKASINLESCYGEVTSTYKYSAYTDAIRIRY
jgi:hypothetical protein